MIDLEAIACLADIPTAQARTRGGDVAVLFEGRATTYAQLDARSDQVARALVAAGVGPGARVGVLTKNHDRWYELFFGAAKARACLTPVNNRLAAGEIAFILEDAAPVLLFVGEDFFDLALKAVEDLASPPRLLALSGAHPGFEDFAAWRDGAAGGPPLARPERDDDVLQLYNRRFLEMGAEVDGFAYDAGESVMIIMPLFHVAGTNVSFAGLAQGCRIVLVKDFSPTLALELMTGEGISHTFLAPAMILMMLHAPTIGEARFERLRTIAYGASPISQDVLIRAKAAFGCGFVQFYGMTESTGAGSYLSPGAHGRLELLKSCGHSWPDVEMAIFGPDGAPAPHGEIGEIVIRGDIVMKGYWNREQATTETLAGGWLRTGDAGYRDAEGFFYIHDRIKDMVVTGGENVYPAEVENAIFGCPGVADVAVIGVPDAKWGEAVKAVVVATGEPPTAEDVIAWARERIAHYKAPKSVDFVEALPRNPSGKVLRRQLREPYWAGRDRSVG